MSVCVCLRVRVCMCSCVHVCMCACVRVLVLQCYYGLLNTLFINGCLGVIAYFFVLHVWFIKVTKRNSLLAHFNNMAIC